MEDVLQFDLALTSLGIPNLVDTLVWRLRLTVVNRLKNETLTSQSINPDLRKDILESSLPRFMWHATATNNTGLVADILFDASDIDSGRYVTRIDVHSEILRDVLNYIRTSQAKTNVGRVIAALFEKQSKPGS